VGRRKATGRWLREHTRDDFVRQSWRSGYRSRAVFKLQELDERDRLLTPGMTVIDLGAAPGGWSQLVAERAGTRGGRAVAVDLLPMEPIPGVEFMLGDVSTPAVQKVLEGKVRSHGAELVLSDMAPSLTGIDAIDQARVMTLAALVVDLCERILAPQGTLLIKVFQGEDYGNFLKQLRDAFCKVYVRKPRASRAQSREVYLLGRGYKRRREGLGQVLGARRSVQWPHAGA
jgi:23S rRNA (uridine2552-2'-O)-methyltransferase